MLQSFTGILFSSTASELSISLRVDGHHTGLLYLVSVMVLTSWIACLVIS